MAALPQTRARLSASCATCRMDPTRPYLYDGGRHAVSFLAEVFCQQFQQAIGVEWRRRTRAELVQLLPDGSDRCAIPCGAGEDRLGVERGIGEAAGVDQGDLVAGQAVEDEDALDGRQELQVGDLGAQLFADLARRGVLAALAELDAAAERDRKS